MKGVWSLFKVAYTLAKRQSDLDEKIKKLVLALNAAWELAKTLASNGKMTPEVERILRSILSEVLNGASLVKEYCLTRHSCKCPQNDKSCLLFDRWRSFFQPSLPSNS